MMMTPRTPGFAHAHVTIDGQDVRGLRCFEANEEEGYIRCYFHMPTPGGARLFPDQDGALRSYTRYGTVVITPRIPAQETAA